MYIKAPGRARNGAAARPEGSALRQDAEVAAQAAWKEGAGSA